MNGKNFGNYTENKNEVESGQNNENRTAERLAE
jgi:hypothetical protein